MRKIRKVIADSDISYYDRNGEMQMFHTTGNIRTVEKAVKALMDAGIVNVLIDDITVHKTTYAMDVDTFIEHAECVVTEHGVSSNDNDTDNDNETEF
ncbi:hypothetical protein [Hominenteromicrobium sp.]|uniref:hypothetical protein n=1 Tax=Hominenteromicrobium sp. TaxID=3073581 RepID=UPI003AB4BF8D